MKKHWLTAIIMAVLLLAQAVAACGGALAEGEEHVHEWSAWESKGTYHEHHCTAEGCDEVETASHDIPCEICGEGVHTHKWSEHYRANDVYHWIWCEVEGCNASNHGGSHVFAGGLCTICNYQEPYLAHNWGDWE